MLLLQNDLKEWLQLLRLDEYYEPLSADRCYGDMEKVTDITWEDLEEIGITKLG
jgi:CASK-interacting protein